VQISPSTLRKIVFRFRAFLPMRCFKGQTTCDSFTPSHFRQLRHYLLLRRFA